MAYVLVNKDGRITKRDTIRLGMSVPEGFRVVSGTACRITFIGGPLHAQVRAVLSVTPHIETADGFRYTAVYGKDDRWYMDCLAIDGAQEFAMFEQRWIAVPTIKDPAGKISVRGNFIAKVWSDAPCLLSEDFQFVPKGAVEKPAAAITRVYDKQRAKGIAQYGVPLEGCALSPSQLADYAMEEVVDAAAYILELKRRHQMLVDLTGAMWNGDGWEVPRG